jgi:hypothetical protein
VNVGDVYRRTKRAGQILWGGEYREDRLTVCEMTETHELFGDAAKLRSSVMGSVAWWSRERMAEICELVEEAPEDPSEAAYQARGGALWA